MCIRDRYSGVHSGDRLGGGCFTVGSGGGGGGVFERTRAPPALSTGICGLTKFVRLAGLSVLPIDLGGGVSGMALH